MLCLRNTLMRKFELMIVLRPSFLLKKLLKDENFKKLTMGADTLFTDEDKKKLRRKFYVTAVDTFEIQQFKTVDKITGMPVDSNVTAPDPYGADQANVETKWAEYVKSLWRMPEEKKEEADLGEKFLMASIAKPAMKAGINSWIDFGKNTADHFAFGPEKKGAILFTSKPGTMVLGQEIYRANTDFAEDVTYGENDTTSGLVAQIRNLMNH